MTLVFFSSFNNFVVERKFLFIVPVNLLVALYTGIRVITGISSALFLVYDARGLPSYVVGSAYFCVQGYALMHSRRELIAEEFNTKANAKRWKHVLQVSQDAVVIFSKQSVLYFNTALRSLLNSLNIASGNIEIDV